MIRVTSGASSTHQIHANRQKKRASPSVADAEVALRTARFPLSTLLPWMKRVSPATASDTDLLSTCSYPTLDIFFARNGHRVAVRGTIEGGRVYT